MVVLPFEKTLKFTPLGYTVAPSGELFPSEPTVFITPLPLLRSRRTARSLPPCHPKRLSADKIDPAKRASLLVRHCRCQPLSPPSPGNAPGPLSRPPLHVQEYSRNGQPRSSSAPTY